MGVGHKRAFGLAKKRSPVSRVPRIRVTAFGAGFTSAPTFCKHLVGLGGRVETNSLRVYIRYMVKGL